MEGTSLSEPIRLRAREVARGGTYVVFEWITWAVLRHVPCEMLIGTALLDVIQLFAPGLQRAASAEASSTASAVASAEPIDTALAISSPEGSRRRPVAVACCAAGGRLWTDARAVNPWRAVLQGVLSGALLMPEQ